MSATPDSTLANPEQRIAHLERQLAEYKAERDQGLQRETATAEVLQVINSSPGDLASVFDAILEKAHAVCGAGLGGLLIYDEEAFRPIAIRAEPSFAEYWRQTPVQPPPGGDAPYAQLIRGERIVHLPDVRASNAYRDVQVFRDLMDRGRIRTLLVVPLRNDGVLLGAITAFRQEVRPFTDQQIALLQNFAQQAVIAMENARLITETREALEQQTATAEVLGVINSSLGNLGPAFDAMLEKATRLCDAAYGVIQPFDGEKFCFGAAYGAPTPLVDFLRQATTTGVATLARLAAGESILHVPDIAGSEAYQSGASAMRRAYVDLGGARTCLVVALRKDATLLGALSIYRREVRPFSERQIALLENFAAQAVIAMENARLLTETREALERQTATAEILRVISASPTDLQPTFDAIATNATILSGAEAGGVFRFDGSLIHFAAHYGYGADLMEAIQRDFPTRPGRHSAAARAILTREVVHIPDAAVDPEYALPAMLQTGVHTVLSVPILQEGNPVGVITVTRREIEPFSQGQIDLLKTFADQAVIAIENVRLFNETREALEQQTATAEILRVINSSPGDLKPVFDAMLEKATSLCGAAFGVLFSWDRSEWFHLVAWRGISHELLAVLRDPFRPQPGTLGERFARGENIVSNADLLETNAYRNGLARVRALVEFGGARSHIGIALRKDDAMLGHLAIYRQEVRPFTDKEIALLQNFAEQAVIAMENVRLIGELRQRTNEVSELNRSLEARVAEQVDELGRVGRLKRFLAPQLAELIVSHGDEKILESHRREIVVVFCDLRGYTAFTETAEPEEVLEFLRQYHGALGPLVSQFEGTLDQFSGDGIMVFFNDPVPCPDPAERAVKMAMAMREEAGKLIAAWRRHGSELGFGAGIAQGYATLGQIGFSDRSGYTAIGTVCNLASRLCAEAKDGQILVSSRIAEAVEAVAIMENLGDLELRGLRRPVAAFNVVQSTSTEDARPNLTVVANEPGAS